MTPMNIDEWNSDLLWGKARMFMARALSDEREGPLFGFWSVLSLELLARSSLAAVHPALLADPREPENLLAAFGFRTTGRSPISIPAKALFARCAVVVPGFTSEDATFCQRLAVLRNEELHAGTAAFADYPTGQWLGDFYRVAKVLLDSVNRDLTAFLGSDSEASAADELITATLARIETTVKESIAAHRRGWEAAGSMPGTFAVPSSIDGPYVKQAPCPACRSTAQLSGDVISIADPRVVEDGIERVVVVQPTRLFCRVCALTITGLPPLYAADHDLASPFSVTMFETPEDFYGIDTHPTPDYEYEYENE